MNDTNTAIDTAIDTARRFVEYYNDRDNWGGTPLVGGNVGGDAADKGYIVNMKLRGWASTFKMDGDVFLEFTAEGVAAAEAMLDSARNLTESEVGGDQDQDEIEREAALDADADAETWG
jgi:hypothetical protein